MNNSLVLNGVTISAQDFGTRILVFLQGAHDAIEARFNSFWNHNATGGELEFWCDNCACFWITDDSEMTCERRLEAAMAFAAQAEIENKGAEISLGKALTVARQRLSQMHWVDWYVSPDVWDAYGMGTSVAAEKGTGNDTDDYLGAVVEKSHAHTQD